MNLIGLLTAFVAFTIAPLLFGIINRTKALLAGREGQPLLQTYFDISKLAKKGCVYSNTTSWIFRAGPIVSASSMIVAIFMLPIGGSLSFIRFEGDLLLFAYFLSLARFFTVLSALDTGSSFEGMGASREVFFSALVEPVFIAGLALLSHESDSISLSTIYQSITFQMWANQFPALALLVVAFIITLLVENSRIPVDDPNTHLELTMIHEVMVLDHSGPDFAYILYGSTLKFWIFGALITNLIIPVRTGNFFIDTTVFILGIAIVAIGIGVIESSMARLRLQNIPKMIVAAFALTLLSVILVLMG